MATRAFILLALCLAPAGCDDPDERRLSVSAIGRPPAMANPNLAALDPPSALLIEATAYGLVRFDGAGEIEPALAQRWIVSDDGLRYIFRLKRVQWPGGGTVRAEQVAMRLRAAFGASSRNPLKPLLGAIDEIEAMTDDVLEISLKSPRPAFLQLLAQPEMAILRAGRSVGGFIAEPAPGGAILLTEQMPADSGEEEVRAPKQVLLRGERAPLAIARYLANEAELVTGGTLGDLGYARAVRLRPRALAFDPVRGLFGLAVLRKDGPLETLEVREALAMAIDRPGIQRLFGSAPLRMREGLLPPGIAEQPMPARPAWTAIPVAERQSRAATAIASASPEEPLAIQVAFPDRPYHRLLFAWLRRDWARIGVDARRVAPGSAADLQLIDMVAPATLASWYLRHFACSRDTVCDPAADTALATARTAATAETRREQLMTADRLLTDAALYIPLGDPLRWSLVSPRLTGFRPNAFARHPAGELIRVRP